MRKRIHGEDSDHPEIAVLLNNLGNDDSDMEEYKKAEEYYRLSLNMYQRIHGEESDHPHIVIALRGLGLSYDAMEEMEREGIQLSQPAHPLDNTSDTIEENDPEGTQLPSQVRYRRRRQRLCCKCM